jgi:putative hydrolase of the HAD superfamily
MKDTIQAVLFDAVGTLFRSRGSIGDIYSDAAARHGVVASPQELDQRFESLTPAGGLPTTRSGWREFVAGVFETSPSFQDFEAFFDDVFSVFRSGTGWRLFPETMAVLEQLTAQGMRLGLVTNFDNRVVPLLDDLGISGFFDAVQTAESSPFQKPDPRFFLEAGKSLSVTPANTLVVGDDPVQDLQGGQRAGMQALLVDRRLRADDRRLLADDRSLLADDPRLLAGDRRPETPGASFIIADLRGVLDYLPEPPNSRHS